MPNIFLYCSPNKNENRPFQSMPGAAEESRPRSLSFASSSSARVLSASSKDLISSVNLLQHSTTIQSVLKSFQPVAKPITRE